MVDNKYANIFPYFMGHIVSSFHKEGIFVFMCILILVFLGKVCVFLVFPNS